VVFDALRFVNTANVNITNEQSQLVFPADIILYPAYPSPFNSSTTLSYELTVNEVVKIDIFNILGYHVKTVLNEKQTSGYKTIIWDGKNESGLPVGAGLYFYQLHTPTYIHTKKMVLVR
jgi:hypothetical protein